MAIKPLDTMTTVNLGATPTKPKAKMGPIEIDPKHKGNLHKYLGIPEDQKIPDSRLKPLLNHSDPAVVKMANFALNARKWKH